MDITELLDFCLKNQASDLHISAGMPPIIRVDGKIRQIDVKPLTIKNARDMIYDVMNDDQRKKFEEEKEIDFSIQAKDSRFRVNAYLQDRGMAAAFRPIPTNPPSLEDIQAPKIFKNISEYPNGLVLVTGPTGSGKSTTLAAIIDHISELPLPKGRGFQNL